MYFMYPLTSLSKNRFRHKLIKTVKRLVYRTFFKNKAGKLWLNANFKLRYKTAAAYWENRYRKKGTSGPGSYGDLAAYKAGIVNKFVTDNKIAKVIEFGCGDGNQLQQFSIPAYIGLDVSQTAIEKCKALFHGDPSKSFFLYDHESFIERVDTLRAGLALSLDVIYHLLEDDVFETYMSDLFACSSGFVIIYAWDVDSPQNLHIRHRNFTKWIEHNIEGWQLIQTIRNETPHPACDFFIYQKR